MNSLLDDDDDLNPRPERELTLTTGAILGIFFGIVLLCGLSFALGLNVGSHRANVALTPEGAIAASGPTANFSAFKPAAGSPVAGGAAIQPTGTDTSSAPMSVPPPSHTVPAPATDDTTPATTTPAPETTPTPPPAALPHAAPITLHPAAAPTPAPAAAPPILGNFIVQVAAVSHQEDADLLVGALKRRGYTVAARTEPQDKLLHIQVGPFNNRKDAEAMRQKLLTDGYNAIIK